MTCLTHLGYMFERENTKVIKVKHLLDLISFYDKYDLKTSLMMYDSLFSTPMLHAWEGKFKF